ncbi:hypothetical protein GN956_G1233 [Arapaima gigas]
MPVENLFMDRTASTNAGMQGLFAAAVPAPNTALSPQVLDQHGETMLPNGATIQTSPTSEMRAPLPDLETARNNELFHTPFEDHPGINIPMPESSSQSTFVHFQGMNS